MVNFYAVCLVLFASNIFIKFICCFVLEVSSSHAYSAQQTLLSFASFEMISLISFHF